VLFCLALNWMGFIFTVTPPGWWVLLMAFTAARGHIGRGW
jgi:hypothetical protein